MAGELKTDQEGKCITSSLLANAAAVTGTPCFLYKKQVAKVGAGDFFVTASLLRKCRILFTVWGSNGETAGAQTFVLRDDVGGGGNVLSMTHNTAIAAAPIIEVGAGGAFDLTSATSIYATCTGDVAGELLIVFVPVA